MKFEEKGEIVGTLVNSNGNEFYLRFHISFYQGGILRMAADDVNIVKHRRQRTASSLGFDPQLPKTDFKS